MKKLTALLLSLLIISGICAQNFSNKGQDFWLGYGYHVNMAGNPAGGGSQDMVLYFTSDKNATVTIEMPFNGYSCESRVKNKSREPFVLAICTTIS
jgi:hypothetical protein